MTLRITLKHVLTYLLTGTDLISGSCRLLTAMGLIAVHIKFGFYSVAADPMSLARYPKLMRMRVVSSHPPHFKQTSPCQCGKVTQGKSVPLTRIMPRLCHISEDNPMCIL